MSREPSRNMTSKGFSNKGDGFGAGEACREMPKTTSNASQTMNSTVIRESVRRVAPEISPATLAQSTAKVNEVEKIWHYQDPTVKIQGPFSMLQLRKWSITGYLLPI